MDRDIKKQILNRLKTVEGHTRGLQRMVEDEQYCVDIVHQVLAVQRALDKVNALILENHLATCVTTAIRGEQPSERERVIHELVGLFTDSPLALGRASTAGPAAVEEPTTVPRASGQPIAGCACGRGHAQGRGPEGESTT